MKFFVYTSITTFLIKLLLCEEKYEFKIMGKNSIKNDILELPNKSKFNIFEEKELSQITEEILETFQAEE